MVITMEDVKKVVDVVCDLDNKKNVKLTVAGVDDVAKRIETAKEIVKELETPVLIETVSDLVLYIAFVTEKLRELEKLSIKACDIHFYDNVNKVKHSGYFFNNKINDELVLSLINNFLKSVFKHWKFIISLNIETFSFDNKIVSNIADILKAFTE